MSMSENTTNYSKLMSELTLALRKSYYASGTADERSEVPVEPSVLTAKQGFGNFPAFYLQGQHCQKSDCGNCTNCFYSQFYYAEPTAKEIEAQCNYVLENFDELVLAQNYGYNEFPEEAKKFKGKSPIFLTLSPTGSFFSNKEFPKEVRLNFLKKLLQKSEELQRDIVLHIEAHSLDVVKEAEHIANSEESELLRKLNTKCILGFESVDEWSRNVLYNKKLPLKHFERAVEVLQSAGIEVGAFTFAGLITHTDTEAKQDMINSVRYLKEKGVFPVLMFANCQSWTIPDVLISQGKHNLLEPFTVLDTTYDALNVLTNNGQTSPGYYLIPEPVEGPPYPDSNIFYGREDIGVSPVSSRRSHEILKTFRSNRNIPEFMQAWDSFRKSDPEYAKYLARIGEKEQNKGTLESRLYSSIQNARGGFENYVTAKIEETKLEREDKTKTHEEQ